MQWAGLLIVLFAVCLVLGEKNPQKTKTHHKESKKQKLHIGVKKRVDCPEKSRSKHGDFLHMHYVGTLEDGTEFDSSLNREPLTFTLGSGQVISGWDSGLQGMCVGEKRKLVIPPHMAYGARGAPPKIPAHATLVFEVELMHIERKDEL